MRRPFDELLAFTPEVVNASVRRSVSLIFNCTGAAAFDVKYVHQVIVLAGSGAPTSALVRAVSDAATFAYHAASAGRLVSVRVASSH